MKVFLTGASGFVGANLARRLVREGHEVHLPLRKNSDLWRLEGILGEAHAHQLDLRDFPGLCKALVEIRPNAIIHMATYGAYPTVQSDFDTIFGTNMVGTINLVRACGKVKYDCFINTSSSSEYGLTKKRMCEGDFPMPVNYYGATKAGATIYCQAHARLTGAPIMTTRLFSVYGPYEEPMRLVPSVIKKCLLNQQIELTQGTQRRDFIYTSDVEDAYLELMGRPDLGGEIINIGTGKQSTVRKIVGEIMIATKTSSVPKWGALPTRTNEAESWVADTRKAGRLLAWRPKTSIRGGVEKTVAWMGKNMERYSAR